MIDRYSNPEISGLWSLENKFRIWLEVEIAVCEAWHQRGLIPAEDMQAIRSKAGFDLQRIEEIEKEVQHDVIAFLTSVKEHVGPAGRWVHYGMTSSDVGDTALCLQMVRAADLLLVRLFIARRHDLFRVLAGNPQAREDASGDDARHGSIPAQLGRPARHSAGNFGRDLAGR